VRAVVLSVLLLSASAVLSAPAPFAKTERPDRGPSAAQLREKRRVSVAFVRPGMTQEQVVEILGHPTSSAGFGGASGTISFDSYPELGVTVTFRNGVVKEVARRE
jgi:outer membrane protein assembly factor BamE (lipoprotein component of BamABCDE complex)